MAKIYTPAEGCCFSHEGKDYLHGDEITKAIFRPESDFDKYIKNGMIVEAIPLEDINDDSKKDPLLKASEDALNELNKAQAKAEGLKAEVEKAEAEAKAATDNGDADAEAKKKALETVQKKLEKATKEAAKAAEKAEELSKALESAMADNEDGAAE